MYSLHMFILSISFINDMRRMFYNLYHVCIHIYGYVGEGIRVIMNKYKILENDAG